ncbi:DoxX family protein [Salibacterium qingdaonense]|uniref:Thiosulfate dehydrogenase [quinone] large subunit n=1 Tax=Salibacterium qingdaonense TaxID=266892 RepID=A0A1I4Q8L9_9BACI|nr:DoxX family protein [Salibacterium qingdaonense]SFM36442.1 thiosulfate dehydrogenase [quinone] large subunit [Salibacterium qingdaonense]
MFIRFLRESMMAAVLLLAARLYLGWTWLTSGLGKITDGFNPAGFLQGAVAEPVMQGGGAAPAYPWYTAFLEHIAVPNADVFGFLVMWGEVLVGAGLIVGLFTTTAAFFGGTMNFAFLLAGTVSTNPVMLIPAILILVGKGNAGSIGLDRFVPALKEKNGRKPKEQPTAKTA